MSKQVIHTDKAPKALGPYSQAIETNGFIFASGQLGIDPETGELQVGAENQMQQALKNVSSLLAEANSGLEKIVKTTIFFKDLANFQAVNAVYGSFFDKEFPARSAFQVAGLPLDAEIEIEVIATK